MLITQKEWTIAVWIQFLIEMAFFISVYYHYLYLRYKGQPHFIYLSLFYIYLVAVLFVTLLPLDFQYFEWGNLVYFSTNNFTEPFRDIFLHYSGAIKGVILNTILFIPFGFLFPLSMLNKHHFLSQIGFFKTILCGMVVILSIEILQMFFSLFCVGFRTFDITDVITNTLGVCIGYLCYQIMCILKDNVFVA